MDRTSGGRLRGWLLLADDYGGAWKRGVNQPHAPAVPPVLSHQRTLKAPARRADARARRHRADSRYNNRVDGSTWATAAGAVAAPDCPSLAGARSGGPERSAAAQVPDREAHEEQGHADLGPLRQGGDRLAFRRDGETAGII